MTSAITPADLAALVRAVEPRAVLGFDVDGVLAPIVEHATNARLTPGVHERLTRLAARTHVAVVSGRSLADLEHRFGFDGTVHLIGSHGLETRGDRAIELTDTERALLSDVERLAADTVDQSGRGAWLERKPASIVVHTRAADPATAGPVVESLLTRLETSQDIHVTRGHEVIELFVRPASKGTRLDALRRSLGRERLVYLGDDVTDETVFTLMSGDDIGVRVGPGSTAARLRLTDPAEVAEFLDVLTTD